MDKTVDFSNITQLAYTDAFLDKTKKHAKSPGHMALINILLQQTIQMAYQMKNAPLTKEQKTNGTNGVGDDIDFNNGQDIITFLREFFASLYSFNGDNIDFNQFFMALAQIEKMLNDPGKYHLTDKEVQDIKALLAANNITSKDKGMDIAEFMVLYLGAQAYEKGYEKGGIKGGLDAVKAEMQHILDIFGDEDNSSIPFIQELLDTARNILKDPSHSILRTQLKKWGLIDDNGKILVDKKDYDLILQGRLDSFMINSDYEKKFRHESIESLFSYMQDAYGYYDKDGKFHWRDPSLVFMILMTALMNPFMDISQSSIGGMKITEDQLAAFQSELSDIISEISKYDGDKNPIDGNTVKDFVTKLLQIVNRMSYNPGRYKDILSNFTQSLSPLLNDPDLKKDFINDGKGPDWNKMADDINKKLKDDPSFLRDPLSSASGVLSNQSSVLKGIMDQKTADINKSAGVENSIFQSIEDLMKFITSKMIAS